MLGQVNSGLFQSHDKTLKYMLVYSKLITNLFRMIIEKFTDPVSSSECWSMVWCFVIKWEVIWECSTSSAGMAHWSINSQQCSYSSSSELLLLIDMIISYHIILYCIVLYHNQSNFSIRQHDIGEIVPDWFLTQNKKNFVTEYTLSFQNMPLYVQSFFLTWHALNITVFIVVPLLIYMIDGGESLMVDSSVPTCPSFLFLSELFSCTRALLVVICILVVT